MQPARDPNTPKVKDDRRIAFVPTDDLSEADVAAALRALEQAGIPAEVIRAGEPAAEKYPAVALPSVLRQPGATEGNASLAELVEALNRAGKPVLHLPAPQAGSGAAPCEAGGLVARAKRLLVATWNKWLAINAPRMGASLAYYTLLSLAPLLILLVSIAGVFFRHSLVKGELMWQVRNLTGNVGESIVRPMLETTKSYTSVIAGVVGMLMLAVGASSVFLELRDSLDAVWGVTAPGWTGFKSLLRDRLFAFLLVAGTGALLVLAILLAVLLGSPVHNLLRFLPRSAILSEGISTGISLVVTAFVFALIYKVVPDTRIQWSDVWIGALGTSVLFTAGKWGIGIYLFKAGVGSAYAAAGSLIVFLTWVYYSVQIFVFGAEFTHQYAIRHGSRAPTRAGPSGEARTPAKS